MSDRDFEILLYGITARTVEKIMQRTGWDEDEALSRFLKSNLYTFLENEETKVWHYSATTLADLFDMERAGQLSFPEV